MLDKLGGIATSVIKKERPVVVTSCLLQAFMACPTKCYLLCAGEIPARGEYTNWVITRRESYRQAAILNLTAHAWEAGIASLELGLSKDAPWQFTVEKIVSAKGWEADIALIQRIPQEGTTPQFVPISFVAANKLSASDKTMAAFEAIALAKALGTKVGVSKIVHGDKRATFSIKASTFSRDVHRKVSQVFALLSAASPPELILNRHCPECGFQGRCRKNAVEKDDLSLLSRLTDKDRARYRSKGIFTVSQLAYTFRPRRRSKRLASRPERYHHALKALAIREHKTHVVGTAKLGMEGTPIFLDVEGLPDRDFYYLISVRVEDRKSTRLNSSHQ